MLSDLVDLDLPNAYHDNLCYRIEQNLGSILFLPTWLCWSDFVSQRRASPNTFPTSAYTTSLGTHSPPTSAYSQVLTSYKFKLLNSKVLLPWTFFLCHSPVAFHDPVAHPSPHPGTLGQVGP